MRIIVFGVLLGIGVTGCEKGAAPVAADQCTKAGEQCKLPDGPLGVCNMEQCKPGQTAPCFRCQPQH